MEGEGARGCNAAGHQPRAAPGTPLRPSPHGHHHLPRPSASTLLALARRPPHRTSYRAPCPLPGRLGGGGDPHNTGARAEGWGESEAARRTPLPPRLSSGEKAASATCPGLVCRRLLLLLLLTPPLRAPPWRRVRPSASRWPACCWPRVRAHPCPHRARTPPRLTLRGSGRVKSGSRACRPISRAAATAPSPPPAHPLAARAYGPPGSAGGA